MKTFFKAEMNAENNSSFSPSAGKPKQFIDFLLNHNIPLDIEGDFEPFAN